MDRKEMKIYYLRKFTQVLFYFFCVLLVVLYFHTSNYEQPLQSTRPEASTTKPISTIEPNNTIPSSSCQVINYTNPEGGTTLNITASINLAFQVRVSGKYFDYSKFVVHRMAEETIQQTFEEYVEYRIDLISAMGDAVVLKKLGFIFLCCLMIILVCAIKKIKCLEQSIHICYDLLGILYL